MNNMANLDRIINAQISLNTTGISSAGFSTLMIVGPHANSLSRVLTITDVDELMDMGFTERKNMLTKMHQVKFGKQELCKTA